jgi:hypothetical protein
MYEPTSQKGLFGTIALWALGIVALILLITAISWGWRYATADPKGRVEAREQIFSGSSRIQAYDHFFNLCAAVQTAEQNLVAAYEELGTAPEDDKQRIRTNITGLLATRNDAVNQYNVDAGKDYTIGQFRASNLPFNLPSTYQKGQVVTCVV